MAGAETITVVAERPRPNGLEFDVDIETAAATRRLVLRLGWADYNLFSPDGADAPERVAAAVVRFLLEQPDLAELPDVFDAAIARRRYRGADAAIGRRLRGTERG